MTKPKTYLAFAAVVALMAAAPAASSAAGFYYETGGTLHSEAASDQVATFNTRTLKCKTASGGGQLTQFAPVEEIVLTVNYSKCVMTGASTTVARVSTAKIAYNAGGTIGFLNKVMIEPTIFGTALCTITLEPQSNLSGVGYANQDSYSVIAAKNVTGISYSVSGGLPEACGGSGGGSNGTLTGSDHIENNHSFWWA